MTNINLEINQSLKLLLAKLPPDISESFSNEQLQALNLALNTPKRHHAINLRLQLGFWHWKYYCNFIFGRDHRELTRREELTKGWVLAIVFWILIFISTLFYLVVLYLIKSALGIDIFPHFSLGIWGWFKSTYLY